MGLIKAITGAAGGVLADQWKEYFYCDSLDADTLMVKGKKRTSGRSSNTSGEDNIISNGSVLAVNNGQCMIIVEQGKVVDLCMEPGEYTYDKSTEPSIFAGDLKESIMATFERVGKRFTFGGDTGKDQRVYYFNMKEIMNNKYGTPQEVPFEIVDKTTGFTGVVNIRCFGVYSYRIADPIIFYTNVAGNVTGAYTRDMIDSQLKSDLLDALNPAFGDLSDKGIKYTQLMSHTRDLKAAMNAALSAQWKEARGIELASINISSIKANEEDEKALKQMQRDVAMGGNARMAAGRYANAQTQAMVDAANNPGGMGAAMGFWGMNMASNAGGVNQQSVLGAIQQNQQTYQQPAAPQPAPAAPAADGWTCSCGTTNTGKFCANCGNPKPAPKPAAGAWTCSCGQQNTGKFCANCGNPKPAPVEADGWTCSCGAHNMGKFCANCGAKKPAGAPLYRCDKCGWEPEDPAHPPKFCPQCGDSFDENDIINK